MLKVARDRDIPNFHIFGEVVSEGVDVAPLARTTRVDRLPAVLDFGFGRGDRNAHEGRRYYRLARCSWRCALRGRRDGRHAVADVHSNHDFGRLGHPRASPLGVAELAATRDAGPRHAVYSARRAGDVLRRRAGFAGTVSIRIRGRICSRAGSRATTTMSCSAPRRRPRSATSIAIIRCMRPLPSCRR